MTQDQGLAGLLGRVEACVGADRELDRAIWKACGIDYRVTVTQPITASLDAALALCTRVLPGMSIQISIHKQTGECNVRVAGRNMSAKYNENVRLTPALALIAAMLRALISKSSESGEGDRASRNQPGCAPKSATSDAEPSGAGEP